MSSSQPNPHSSNSDLQAEFPPRLPLTILVPVYDDWAAAELLVERIDSVFGEYALSGQLLFIDDGSFDSLPEQFPKITPRNIQQIQRVELRTNLGHQRALCVGLVHLAQGDLAGPVVIMDADGEDAPSDISRLLNKFVRRRQAQSDLCRQRPARGGVSVQVFLQALSDDPSPGGRIRSSIRQLQRFARLVPGTAGRQFRSLEPLCRRSGQDEITVRDSSDRPLETVRRRLQNGIRRAGRSRSERDVGIRRQGWSAPAYFMRALPGF